MKKEEDMHKAISKEGLNDNEHTSFSNNPVKYVIEIRYEYI
jgi:hypothetical protein